MEHYFPDPEIDSIKAQQLKENSVLSLLESKLNVAKNKIGELQKTKKRIEREIEERREKKQKLNEQAKTRSKTVLEKWIAIAPRYHFVVLK